MSERLLIRRMEPADVEAVSRIEAECFSQPWSATAYRDALTDEKYLYLCAEVEGRIVGMCGVLQILDEGDISNVAVTEHMRGKGIAGRMLAELLARGTERGILDFTLEVRVSNLAAIRLYEAHGFRSEGIRPGFYEEPREDAMIMWRRTSNYH